MNGEPTDFYRVEQFYVQGHPILEWHKMEFLVWHKKFRLTRNILGPVENKAEVYDFSNALYH